MRRRKHDADAKSRKPETERKQKPRDVNVKSMRASKTRRKQPRQHHWWATKHHLATLKFILIFILVSFLLTVRVQRNSLGSCKKLSRAMWPG